MSICIVGMSMGSWNTLTLEAQQAIKSADMLIGSARLLHSAPDFCSADRRAAIAADDIIELVQSSTGQTICVLMSGDVGFYSGATKLIDILGREHVTVIPGISSVQYFAAKLKRSWQDWKLVSAHGKTCDVVGLVRNNSETFFLTGGTLTANVICQALTHAGYGDITVNAGINLGHDHERIITCKVSTFPETDPNALIVLLIDNPMPRGLVSCGLSDDDFIRGDIPMTKSEVRSVILSKLQLCDDDIFYDVGAGTGSVSVEAALLLTKGHVYAFEREDEGCQLIKTNAQKHRVSNLTVIEGDAPQTFEDLPIPTVAFIGGSGGNLEDIINDLMSMNPDIRLVVSAVALETLEQASSLFFSLPLKNVDIVQVAVSRSRKLGGHHLMTAQNPIFLFSGTGYQDI